MAKKKSYPKSPKMSSSADVWKRYEDKVKAVDKYNSEMEKAKKTKLDTIKRVQKIKGR